MKNVYFYDTNMGRFAIVDNDLGITDISIDVDFATTGLNVVETELIKEAAKELIEYLDGNRVTFDVPFALYGTDFQRSVWKALCDIPYGETRSYKQIAEAIGNPKASRAVGLANNRNPIIIMVPCHRVIGANGKLVGYGGGLDMKERLLNLEKKHSKSIESSV